MVTIQGKSTEKRVIWKKSFEKIHFIAHLFKCTIVPSHTNVCACEKYASHSKAIAQDKRKRKNMNNNNKKA